MTPPRFLDLRLRAYHNKVEIEYYSSSFHRIAFIQVCYCKCSLIPCFITRWQSLILLATISSTVTARYKGPTFSYISSFPAGSLLFARFRVLGSVVVSCRISFYHTQDVLIFYALLFVCTFKIERSCPIQVFTTSQREY